MRGTSCKTQRINTMNKYYYLFALHIIFWLVVLVLMAFLNLTIRLLGNYIPVTIILTLGCLPVLLFLSWRAEANAPTQPLKKYFYAFRWIALGLLVFDIFCIYACVWATLQESKTGTVH